MTTEPLDPLMDALFELKPVAPRESHDRRVRRQCHALLAGRRHAAPRIRGTDLMVAAGVALYLVAMVKEAVRLLG